MNEAFERAVDNTRRVIEGMTDDMQVARRIGLLEVIIWAQRTEQHSLEIEQGSPGEGEMMDIVILNHEATVRCYAVDMRLVILVASLAHPEVVTYINEEFPPSINPQNDSEAEAIATTISKTPNLVGLWELVQQGPDSWLLQLVCPNGHTKPIHGTLLVR